jgi:hypothetical protein
MDTVELALDQVSGSASIRDQVRGSSSSTCRRSDRSRGRGDPDGPVALDSISQTGTGKPSRHALKLDGPGQDGSAIRLEFFASGELIHEDVLQEATPR